jgi:sensor domain CHASE-containing protein
MKSQSDKIMQIMTKVLLFLFLPGFLAVLLAIIGYFSSETLKSIKYLEKEMVDIKVSLESLEQKRVSRQEIKELIQEYHDTHPCRGNKQ